MNRRTFFGVCVGGLFATSGCLGNDDSVRTDIDIINTSGEEVTVDIELTREGEIVFSETYTIAPDTLAGETDLAVGEEFLVRAIINEENEITEEYSAEPECTDNGVTVMVEAPSNAEIYIDNC
jgi:hypothetical protein